MQKQEKAGWEPKSRLAGALTLIALILAGGCAGSILCRLMAPDSEAANAISVIMLPISVVIGTFVWQVIIITYISWKLGSSFLKGFKKGGVKAALCQKAEGIPPYPPGTSAFVFVSVSVCLIAGVVVAFTRNAQSFLSVVGLYGFTGLVYGLLQRYLVRAGYFITFESGAGTRVDDKDAASQREGQKTIEN